MMVLIGRITPPNVGLAFSSDNVQLKIGHETIGTGSVYISQNSLVWRPDNLEQDGISIFWKQISVHGISSTPSNCIYFMLDHQLKWPGIYEGDIHNHSNGIAEPPQSGSENESEDEENDVYEDAEEVQMTECWLIPQDSNCVNTMYQAMTECQALHPDSDDSISGDSEYMDDEEECDDNEIPVLGGIDENASVEQARDNMNNMSLNDDRFADADE
ncbi:methylosome subunit pICln [Lucilia cuprina]|uniref:methylosome subunit pICln n=1 Tax=Lucilia cuprina TaxID=7375 RepID=UPI001F05F8C9|nr:methylosome subunit pICln [Lucilia cuprina]